MRVEVDQSTKIEQSGPTILALANGKTYAIVIPGSVKTAGLKVLEARGKTKDVAYPLLFAACLYLLLKDHLNSFDSIILDIEYRGKNEVIKSYLLEYIKKQIPNYNSNIIDFAFIGKGSPADKKARRVREKRDKDFKKIELRELLKVIA